MTEPIVVLPRAYEIVAGVDHSFKHLTRDGLDGVRREEINEQRERIHEALTILDEHMAETKETLGTERHIIAQCLRAARKTYTEMQHEALVGIPKNALRPCGLTCLALYQAIQAFAQHYADAGAPHDEVEPAEA